MKLLTTTIGAYPKPDYVALPDWFGMEETNREYIGGLVRRPSVIVEDGTAEEVLRNVPGF